MNRWAIVSFFVLLIFLSACNPTTNTTDDFKELYSIQYIDYDGTLLQKTSHVYESNITTVTPPPIPNKEGYTFLRWDKNLPKTMPKANIIITAEWSINQYTISCFTHDGSTVTIITEDFNISLNEPDNPIREGYVFTGWYTDESFTTAYVFDTMPAKDIDLYAGWEKEELSLIDRLLAFEIFPDTSIFQENNSMSSMYMFLSHTEESASTIVPSPLQKYSYAYQFINYYQYQLDEKVDLIKEELNYLRYYYNVANKGNVPENTFSYFSSAYTDRMIKIERMNDREDGVRLTYIGALGGKEINHITFEEYQENEETISKLTVSFNFGFNIETNFYNIQTLTVTNYNDEQLQIVVTNSDSINGYFSSNLLEVVISDTLTTIETWTIQEIYFPDDVYERRVEQMFQSYYELYTNDELFISLNGEKTLYFPDYSDEMRFIEYHSNENNNLSETLVLSPFVINGIQEAIFDDFGSLTGIMVNNTFYEIDLPVNTGLLEDENGLQYVLHAIHSQGLSINQFLDTFTSNNLSLTIDIQSLLPTMKSYISYNSSLHIEGLKKDASADEIKRYIDEYRLWYDDYLNLLDEAKSQAEENGF